MITKDQKADLITNAAIEAAGDAYAMDAIPYDTFNHYRATARAGWIAGALWMQETLKQQEAVCRDKIRDAIMEREQWFLAQMEAKERAAWDAARACDYRGDFDYTFEGWKRSINTNIA